MYSTRVIIRLGFQNWFLEADTLSMGQLPHFKMDTPCQIPELRLLLTTCKRHKSVARERGKREGHKSHLFSPLVLHVLAARMGDLMSRKGLSDQTAGCFSPTAPRLLSISVPWFYCFPFPVTPGKAVVGGGGGPNTANFPTHSSSKCLGTAAHCWHSFT